LGRGLGWVTPEGPANPAMLDPVTTSVPHAGELPGQPQIPWVASAATTSPHIPPSKLLENRTVAASVAQCGRTERRPAAVTHPPTSPGDKAMVTSDLTTLPLGSQRYRMQEAAVILLPRDGNTMMDIP